MNRASVVTLVLGILTFADLRAVDAQAVGSVAGVVTREDGRTPATGVDVAIADLPQRATTSGSGRFVLRGLPPGSWTLVFTAVGYETHEIDVTVGEGEETSVTVALEVAALRLAELLVDAASRTPQRVVEAPAAISIVRPATITAMSLTSQVPAALASLPGVEVVQSGMFDFNVNTRGFNSSLTRRMLVLQDGRDLSIAVLGLQEWSGFSAPLSDFRSIEVVRGPGSALYGANAYSGVIDLRTWGPRDVAGLKATIAGGGLNSISGDVRYAALSPGGKLGFKVNAGYSRSDSWTRSRTDFDGGSLRREYADATDRPVPDQIEVAPLMGQSVDPTTGVAFGEPDPVTRTFGSARVDYYRDNGGVVTAESGAALSENTAFVTGVGRIQIDESFRPWSSIRWAEPEWNISAWYSGRSTLDSPTRFLASGATTEDKSSISQIEAQIDRQVGDRLEVIVGGAVRNTHTDTKETFFLAADDDRRDWYYSMYSQGSLDLSDELELIGAVRFDGGDLFDTQISPRLALVFSPRPAHSFRITAGRAFQTPSQVERFLAAAAAPPADLSSLEAGLRASPLGSALAGVPDGELFTTSASVPILARGNPDLKVESVQSLEAGYKGQLADGVFLTVDAYYSRLTDFTTDVLPGVNPNFAPWTAPSAVQEAFRGPLEEAVREQLAMAGQSLAAAGLTRLSDQSTAVVLSYGNAGKAKEYGVELELSVAPSSSTLISGNYSYFGNDISAGSLVPGDQLVPNAPTHRGGLSVDFSGGEGFDFGATLRVMTSYEWAAGVYAGQVPSSQMVDLRAGMRLMRDLRLHAVATNVFNQQRFQMFGGSVMGRRVMVGLTVHR